MEAPPTEILPDVGEYAYWYLGADFSYSFILLISFWSMLVSGAVLRKVAQSHPIKINDLTEYRKGYEKLTELAFSQITLTAIAIAISVFGILYWGISIGTTQYQLVMYLLLVITGIGVAAISWLNLSGIHEGLEKTKKQKIDSICDAQLAPHRKDVQISVHSKITFRDIGPRIVDNVLISLIVAELPTLLKFVFDNLN